ncbi:MAG TPA: hypothetical protein VKF81_00050 [Blastocatellia bacterium]|nr:hypothetical protein [Blastocatellia bacterium]
MRKFARSPLSSVLIRRVSWVALAVTAMLAYGCGSDSSQTVSTGKYPTGISEDIEQQLKYDSRVDSFDSTGDDLTINVNDQWMNSPAGMQERAVGQWYGMWHSNHSGGVIVQHDGDKVASWSSEGYRPETKTKNAESRSQT